MSVPTRRSRPGAASHSMLTQQVTLKGLGMVEDLADQEGLIGLQGQTTLGAESFDQLDEQAGFAAQDQQGRELQYGTGITLFDRRPAGRLGDVLHELRMHGI